ncbi:hypothetical protein, partial [Pseudomonas viridiflava]|uniref:hypothetical protein n=1 Tax=Pseudomonas viridiflava TaxID=33069 RepID=UPI0019D21CB8
HWVLCYVFHLHGVGQDRGKAHQLVLDRCTTQQRQIKLFGSGNLLVCVEPFEALAFGWQLTKQVLELFNRPALDLLNWEVAKQLNEADDSGLILP